MKSVYVLLALSLVAPGANASTPEEEIAALESQLEAGLAARDRKLLEPLIAEPFTWVHGSDGRVDQREDWLANAARGMALSGQKSARSEHGASLVFYGDPVHTAVRVTRVRLLDPAGKRESWMRQTHTLVRGSAGKWQLAMGQGVIMYDGPPLDPALHARYAGVYVLGDGRQLVLEWSDGALLATFPSGAHTQVFLASPTQEAIRNPAAGALTFTLDANGSPTHAALVRAGQEQWRAARK